jgi:hypothetical protein
VRRSCTLVSRRRYGGTEQNVRTMFATYLVLIVAGIVLYLVVALTVE